MYVEPRDVIELHVCDRSGSELVSGLGLGLKNWSIFAYP
jgi:hypothetical protein